MKNKKKDNIKIRKAKDRTNQLIYLLFAAFVLSFSVAYASINRELSVSGEGTFRPIKDMRVSAIRLHSTANDAMEMYEPKYNVASTTIGAKLPNTNSEISFAVDITNYGTVAQWVDSIDSQINSENVNFAMTNYTLKTMIMPGETKTLYLTYTVSSSYTSNDAIIFDGVVTYTFYQPESILVDGYGEDGGDSAFNGPINKNQIESVEFLPTLEVGSNALTMTLNNGDEEFVHLAADAKSWDASRDYDETVIAWCTDTDNNGLYELHFGCNGKIYIEGAGGNMAFGGLTKTTSIDFNNCLDTSRTTNMADMFYDCKSLENLDVSSFNTNLVTDMQYMFYECKAIEHLDLSKFSYASANDMDCLFANCSALKTINLGASNTPNLTTMQRMFQNDTVLKSIDLSHFDISKIKSFAYMFSKCNNIETITLPNTVSNDVTTFQQAFRYCNKLKSIDLSMFRVTKVTSVSYMFGSCTSLESINLSNWNLSKITTIANLFSGLTSLTSVNLTGFNAPVATNMSNLFKDCSNITTISMPDVAPTKVTNISSIFNGCSKLTTLNIPKFDFSKVTTSTNAFTSVPENTAITVKDQASKDFILGLRSDFTNITIAT